MAMKVSHVRKNLDESAITAGGSYRHQRHIAGHDAPFVQCQRTNSFVFKVACTQGIRRCMVFYPEIADGIRCQQTAIKASPPHKDGSKTLHPNGIPSCLCLNTRHIPQNDAPIRLWPPPVHDAKFPREHIGSDIPQFAHQAATCSRIADEGNTALLILVKLHGEIHHLIIYRRSHYTPLSAQHLGTPSCHG